MNGKNFTLTQRSECNLKAPASKNAEIEETFVSEKSLEEYCSLFTPDGIPANISQDPHLAEMIKFSDEELEAIAKVHNQREKLHIEENKKKEEKEIAEQKLKTKLDKKVDEILREKAFHLKRQCPVKIPYKSSLTHEEHAAYLRVFLKIKETPSISVAETNEYQNYLCLQHRVYEEQTKFMNFSHEVSSTQLQSYNAVPDNITKYIDEYVQKRCKRALKYKEHYIIEQQVPICPQDPMGNFNQLTFNHIGHLWSLGTIPQFFIPSKLKQNTLKIDDTLYKKERQPKREKRHQNILNDTPVSYDRNAEYLAQQHRANIVISTSALKVLADNYGPNFDKEWDIPVEVKSHLVHDSNGKEIHHRVVYIDKPMPKKIWTPLEKKQLYFKKSAMAIFTKIKRKEIFSLKRQLPVNRSESRTLAEYDDNIFDLSQQSCDDSLGENFEITKSTNSSKKRKVNEEGQEECSELLSTSNCERMQDPKTILGNHKLNSSSSNRRNNSSDDISPEKKETSECSSSSSYKGLNTKEFSNRQSHENNSQSFLENLIDMQDSMLKCSPSKDVVINDEKDKASMSNVTPSFPWSNTISTKWNKTFKPQKCSDWTGKNVHYQLFSLGPDTGQSTRHMLPIRVLVRSNLHGLSFIGSDPEKSKAYIAFPKVESQPFFGCEVTSLSEVTNQWVQLLVRPNTSLLHLRTCHDSGEILMTEERDLGEVLRDGKQHHIGFSSHQPLATFYSVFNAVLGQPSGHYLLHHDLKTKAFIQLMKAIDPEKEINMCIYNLHKEYDTATVDTRLYTVPPWLAIDTHVLTPFHKFHKKIPATFPMNNPDKILTKVEKKKIIERSKNKKSLEDLKKTNK